MNPSPTDQRDDAPITLREACELYPAARFTVSTLRLEAERGRLAIYKVGRRYYTTPADLRAMVQACRVASNRPDSTSTESEANGSSETERIASARAALNQSVEALKRNLPRISRRSTRRSAAPTHW